MLWIEEKAMENREIDSPLVEKRPENSGSWLWKNLKPFGCILCLVCMAAMLIVCFSSGMEDVPGYERPESREFYLSHPQELAGEIINGLAPELEHIIDCQVDGDKVTVFIEQGHLVSTRSVILKYFDEENLEFSTEK